MNIEHYKSTVIDAIESLRKKIGTVPYPDKLVTQNLDWVKDMNVIGESICGNSSNYIVDNLAENLKHIDANVKIFRVTSAMKNSSYHHYNYILFSDGTPLIVDLSLAQFFTKPMDLLGENPYFVGTRAELKTLHDTAQQNTWNVINNKYKYFNLRSLWDFDYHIPHSKISVLEIIEHFKTHEHPCLIAESFYYGWEMTWGNQSRIINSNALTDNFNLYNIDDLQRDTVPAPENLITYNTWQQISIDDAPSLMP